MIMIKNWIISVSDWLFKKEIFTKLLACLNEHTTWFLWRQQSRTFLWNWDRKFCRFSGAEWRQSYNRIEGRYDIYTPTTNILIYISPWNITRHSLADAPPISCSRPHIHPQQPVSYRPQRFLWIICKTVLLYNSWRFVLITDRIDGDEFCIWQIP